jgi:hypothetical protein
MFPSSCPSSTCRSGNRHFALLFPLCHRFVRLIPQCRKKRGSTRAGFKGVAAQLTSHHGTLPNLSRDRPSSTLSRDPGDGGSSRGRHHPEQHHNLPRRCPACTARYFVLHWSNQCCRDANSQWQQNRGASVWSAHPEVLDLASSPHDPFHSTLVPMRLRGETTSDRKTRFFPDPGGQL